MKIFQECLGSLDNSMGDFNKLPFNFIDDKNLNEEFKTWLIAQGYKPRKKRCKK